MIVYTMSIYIIAAMDTAAVVSEGTGIYVYPNATVGGACNSIYGISCQITFYFFEILLKMTPTLQRFKIPRRFPNN